MQGLSEDTAPGRTSGLSAPLPRGRAARLRRLAVVRSRTAGLLLLAPTAMIVVVDVMRRLPRIAAFRGFYAGTYAAAVLESLLVWGTLLYAASRRRGASANVLGALFVIGITLTVGGQRYFHDQYNAYLNVDVSLFATNFMDSVVNQLFADIGNYAWATLPPLILAVAALVAARRVIRPARLPARITSAVAPLLVVAAFFVPTQNRHVQASTPDVLYLHGVGGLLRTQLGLTDQSKQLRPTARESLPVALTTPAPARRPNVLFVILESVRADAACTRREAGCRKTPFTDAAVPDRFPLTQLRSLASSTAISLAVLWSGVGAHEPREVLHSWPLLFDYARARGYDTAFYTSQNMMFGNARLWVQNLGVSQFVSATDLDPESDLDMGAPESLLADHVNRRIGELREPFLAVVQLSNMHYPYLVDTDGEMPFAPWTTSKAEDENTAFYNYYLNGVRQQDAHVARMLRRVKESALAKNTVIVYTSDHGEAFRDHNQMGHTFSVLDEEIHVPGFVDAPPGFFTGEEEENLRKAENAFTFHPDLTATVLDLLGVWSDPGIARYREKMLGQSLLRGGREDRAVALTNCAGVWSCAFENWGFMRGKMKLEARAWDPSWHCFDVEADPLEARNLPSAECGDLEDRALGLFERLPGGEKK